ncbi:hypothetical protein BPOR_0147g00040 [Botrytis porri]|uniref:Uncharacterized protein n=1 Tax=Botrytis porri TaxID=87229 RepID=A0A4Z1KVY8_9HELO|nr:hypothetical protein BPOR_0147g00040 [Botrytis porri]
MSTPSGSGSRKDRKVSRKPKVLSDRSQKTPSVTAQPDQRPPVAPPASDNTPEQASVNVDQQARDITTGHNPESVRLLKLTTLPSQRPNLQNSFADPFKWQPLPGEPLSPSHGSSLPQDIWKPQNYRKHGNTRNNGAAHGTPLGPDIWKPQSYARDGDRDSHGSRLFTPTPNPRRASSRMDRVNSNQRIPPLTHAAPPTNNRFAQRLPPLAPAAPKSKIAYAPGFPSSSKKVATNSSSAIRQSLLTPAAPQHPRSTQVVPNPSINYAAQPPVVNPTTTLDYIPSEAAEELRDRLFKLTSDYQRLYSIFMPSGHVSPHAARWNSIDIDLPYLFEVRQQVINCLVATKRFENGEEIKDVEGFKETQKLFFKNLEEAVDIAIEKMTWLRRELEGPDGCAYQHRNWYYQVIGNNLRSTCLPSAREDGDVEGGDAGDSDKATRHGDEHGNLVSPSLDSEDEKEMRAEKRMRM